MVNGNYSWFWITADQCIIEQKVLLYGLIITASVATKTVVSIYDGVNSNGKIIGTFRVSADDSESFTFSKPIKCNYGLYFDVDDNLTGVLVVYEILKPQG